jgi:hypothetical protein
VKVLRVVVVLAVAAAVAGCAFAPVVPPRGMVYNDQKAPLFGGRETGAKEGQASAASVLMLVGWGDCSIDAAASAGAISQIKHVDYRYRNILGVYQSFTTIVKGE